MPASPPDISISSLADALVQGNLSGHGPLDQQGEPRTGPGRAGLQQLLQVAASAGETQLRRLQQMFVNLVKRLGLELAPLTAALRGGGGGGGEVKCMVSSDQGVWRQSRVGLDSPNRSEGGL